MKHSVISGHFSDSEWLEDITFDLGCLSFLCGIVGFLECSMDVKKHEVLSVFRGRVWYM